MANRKLSLYYHKAKGGNFGDDLNTWLWRVLLPGVVDSSNVYDGSGNSSIFIGIGSILNHYIPAGRDAAVLGAGHAYGGLPPMDRLRVYAVRGPLTAKTLGLPHSSVATDAAALLSTVPLPDPKPQRERWLFMPHASGLERIPWKPICRSLGIGYVDPRSDTLETIAQIQSADGVIAEAMHAAIVADTLRVPWIPIRVAKGADPSKWTDWCASLNVVYKPVLYKPPVRGVTNPSVPRLLARGVNAPLAAAALTAALRFGRPQLSTDVELDRATDKLLTACDRLRKDFDQGAFA